MIATARAFVGARDLLWQWVGRTLQARYQQSLLGWLWAVIQPVAQTAILAVVFTRFVTVNTGDTPYLVFAYVAIVAWGFLATSLTDMTSSLVDNMNLVNKIYFPREVLPIASMLARLTDLGVALALFVGLAVYYRLPLLAPALVFLPSVLIVQVLLVTGVGLACAAGNVFVRDVRSLLLLTTQLWFYASPVIYPLESVPEAIRPYYMLNPMTGIIEGYRSILIHARVPDGSFLAAALISVAAFGVGYGAFKRAESRFADLV
jgi:lipopolysaccharide transport system permease protein